MKNILLIIVMVSIFIQKGFSQDTTKAKIITYDAFQPTTINPETDVKVDKNAIKWNISLLTRGIFLFNWEHSFKDIFSLEGGLGLTYRDFTYELFDGMSNDNIDFLENDENEQTVKPGIAFELMPRIYPRDGYLEGFYFGPIYRFRKYNVFVSNYKEYNNSYTGDDDYYLTISGTKNYGYRTSEFGFIVGYQTDESWFYDCSWDYYFGASLRSTTSKEIENSGSKLRAINKISTSPALLYGIKIGLFQFK